MKNLAQAILKVMEEVKGIDKSMTVGNGANSYKGVPDQEVKKIIGEAMRKNGLVILPTSVKPKIQIDRWAESGQYGEKQKQSVFTEVETEYLLIHDSGESITLSGYGHGVDSQDKGAGKATTYALKYTLLYMFLVPTGKIDDSDSTHSEHYETPAPQQPEKPYLNKFTTKGGSVTTTDWNNVVKALQEGKAVIADVKKKFKLSKEIETELNALIS